jgi:uncharacterized repeat protein (TIGR02543 family)
VVIFIKGLIRFVFLTLCLIAVTYLALEPIIVEDGRLTVTTEETTEGETPEYRTYTFGSHAYEEFVINVHYPSGRTKKIPFNESMISESDLQKFEKIGKHEILISFKKATLVLKIEVVLPSNPYIHVVIFETNGGNLIPALTNIENGSVINLPIPVKPGYIFLGWYQDKNLQVYANQTFVVNQSVILYALWGYIQT